MIDPLTAFALAQGAIKGIQAAIKMGKDVQGITSDVLLASLDCIARVITVNSAPQNASSEAFFPWKVQLQKQ